MKLQNDGEEEYGRLGIKMPTVILVASAAIFGVLAVVLLANGTGNKTRKDYMTNNQQTETVEQDAPSTLTAGDLDFWDMYQNGDNTVDTDQRKEAIEERAETIRLQEKQEQAEKERLAEEDDSIETDGKHTKVTHLDGTSEWIDINSSLKTNSFDDTFFQAQNGILGYYQNGIKTTKTGVDISQYTTVDDWTRLSTEADYVMIRVGARGYDTGKIIADTKFVENVVNAVKYKIPYGVYFSSQAVTEAEAKEEANYVINQLAIAQVSAINTVSTNTDVSNSNGATTNNTTNNTTTNGTTTSGITNTTPGYTNGQAWGTTSSSTDVDGNTTTIQLDEKGNSVTTVKDKSGNTIKTTTVYTDPYGNVTTTVTDADGKQTVDTVNIGTGAAVNDATGQTINSNSSNNTNAKITYPIAVDMHQIINDTSRIDGIDASQRTAVLSAYCDTIAASGYEPMILATKEFVLCKLELGKLGKYDIWLANDGDLPDYPYQMGMWKYNSAGNLMKSLSGQYGVDMSFIDYTIR